MLASEVVDIPGSMAGHHFSSWPVSKAGYGFIPNYGHLLGYFYGYYMPIF